MLNIQREGFAIKCTLQTFRQSFKGFPQPIFLVNRIFFILKEKVLIVDLPRCSIAVILETFHQLCYLMMQDIQAIS